MFKGKSTHARVCAVTYVSIEASTGEMAVLCTVLFIRYPTH